MALFSRWFRFPAELFFQPADERIYALVRMAFAVVALLNLIFLWPDRLVFFSAAGLADSAAAANEARPVYLSIFAFADSEVAVTALMLIAAGALVMLLVGVCPRLAAAWSLIWHVSYMARSPLPLAGWDLVLRCFSFLILVSPLGVCWTLPSLLRGGKAPANVSGHGLILMRLQVVVIYWQAVLARFLHPDPYWKNGEFLSYFMLSHHSRWPGRWVLEYGGLLACGTYAILLLETAVPVLLWRKKTRWWGMLLGAALHIGISLFAPDLGLFCLSMMMTYLAFLRSEDVVRLGIFTSRRTQPASN